MMRSEWAGDPSVSDWRKTLREEHEKKGCWGVDHAMGCEATDPRNSLSADEADVSRLERVVQGAMIQAAGEADDPFEDAVDYILAELRAIMLKKHADYGPLNIALAPGGAINGLRVRMHDKLARINNLFDKGVEPNNESLEDSFLDLSNYGIIGMMVLRGQWPGTER